MNASRLSDVFKLILPDELAFLKRVIATLSEIPVIVDIGTGAGTTLLGALEVRPQAKILTIDIFPTSVSHFLSEAGLGASDVTFITKASVDAARLYQDQELDVLIIDGNHLQAEQDLRAWVPMLRVGGIVLVHDYGTGNAMWQIVKAAVDKFARYNALTFDESVGTLAKFTKGEQRRGRRSNV